MESRNGGWTVNERRAPSAAEIAPAGANRRAPSHPRWLFRWFSSFALSAALCLASSASAVLIAGPDGATNTTAPNPDPGFANVGVMSGLSGTYVRNGWVLTANHVGIGPIVLDGITYDPVPGSSHRFSNHGALPYEPDLIAFKLQERPPLSELFLASSPIATNDELILVGNGLSRGAVTSWSGGGPPPESFDGWLHSQPRIVRWGTNKVDAIGLDIPIGTASETRSIATTFDDLKGQASNDPEAQVVAGDSGGAAFYWNGGSSELVGILFARGTFNPNQYSQPLDRVLYENISIASDLYFYGNDIDDLIDQPDCDDGLDVDGDGFFDYPEDPGCDDALDFDETSLLLPCDNGIDDDLDGFTDFPADDGCDDSFDLSEVPEPGLASGIAIGFAALLIARARRRTSSRSSGRSSWCSSGR
jgi:hypothetical protein